jgi:hypothetical protein
MPISHRNIKRFYLDGEIYDESAIPRLREQYIQMLMITMRAKGFVIRYDIDPDFTLSYNGKTFDFKLSVYGVFVGKRKAECLAGIDKNREVMMTTHQNKSSGSSKQAV